MANPKTVFVVPKMHVRELVENKDTRRMLASGSWVEVPAHKMRPPTKAALRQRRHRAKKRMLRDMITKSEQ